MSRWRMEGVVVLADEKDREIGRTISSSAAVVEP
jgi:hypothetical protein